MNVFDYFSFLTKTLVGLMNEVRLARGTQLCEQDTSVISVFVFDSVTANKGKAVLFAFQ